MRKILAEVGQPLDLPCYNRLINAATRRLQRAIGAMDA